MLVYELDDEVAFLEMMRAIAYHPKVFRHWTKDGWYYSVAESDKLIHVLIQVDRREEFEKKLKELKSDILNGLVKAV